MRAAAPSRDCCASAGERLRRTCGRGTRGARGRARAGRTPARRSPGTSSPGRSSRTSSASAPSSCAHALVEARAGQRIRHRHADVVRLAARAPAAASLRCRPRSRRDSRTAGRTPTSMPGACSRPARGANVARRGCPSPSRRESSASRTRRPSRPSGSRRGAAPARPRRRHLIGAHQALERHARVRSLHERGELLDPARLQAEDVVDDPEVIGREVLLEPRDLVDDAPRAARRRSAGRRSASRTSCSDTGSRASWRCSSSSSRGARARSRGSARRRPGPRPGTAARRGRG